MSLPRAGAGTSVTASEVGIRAADRSGLRSSWMGKVESLDSVSGTLQLRGQGGIFIGTLHVDLSADTVLVSHIGDVTFRAIRAVEGLLGTYAFVRWPSRIGCHGATLTLSPADPLIGGGLTLTCADSCLEGFTVEKGVTPVLTRGKPLDLLVAAEGYRPVLLRGVTSDT